MQPQHMGTSALIMIMILALQPQHMGTSALIMIIIQDGTCMGKNPGGWKHLWKVAMSNSKVPTSP